MISLEEITTRISVTGLGVPDITTRCEPRSRSRQRQSETCRSHRKRQPLDPFRERVDGTIG